MRALAIVMLLLGAVTPAAARSQEPAHPATPATDTHAAPAAGKAATAGRAKPLVSRITAAPKPAPAAASTHTAASAPAVAGPPAAASAKTAAGTHGATGTPAAANAHAATAASPETHAAADTHAAPDKAPAAVKVSSAGKAPPADAHQPPAKGRAKPLVSGARAAATPDPAAVHAATPDPAAVAPIEHMTPASGSAPPAKSLVKLSTVHGRIQAALAELKRDAPEGDHRGAADHGGGAVSPTRLKSAEPARPGYAVTWPMPRWRVEWPDADRILVAWPVGTAPVPR